MKFLLPFLLFVFTAQISFPQVNLGIKAGASHATLHFPMDFIDAENNYITSFYIGANTNFDLNEKCFFLLELMYTEKGAAGRPGTVFDEKLSLSYANMPILFNFRATKWLVLYSGSDIGLLISAKMESPLGKVLRANPFFQTFDLGLAAGFSIGLAKGLYFEARYIEGLTRIQEGIITKDGGHDKAGRNRSVQVGLGYRLFQH